MTLRIGLATLAALQLLAGVAFAQPADVAAAGTVVAASDEFGRVSGGELDLLTKHSSRLSGSFGIMASRSSDPLAFGDQTSRGYGASVGGTVVPDRVWFFAAAEQSAPITSRFLTNMPQNAAIRGIDAKAMGQLGDRSSLAGSFSATRASAVTDFVMNAAPTPSSFLSLHYSGMMSSNVLFNASVSRTTVSQVPVELLAPR